jgi:hypothetical protein
MPITPFIEAPFVRTISQPVSGGINTSAYDKFRQGISITTDRELFGGMFPKMKPANQRTPTGFQESTVFGQPALFNAEKPFVDIEKFNPVKFINGQGQYEIYPDVLDDSSFLDPYEMDGAIEPLAIRKAVALSTLAGREYAHRIRGSMQAGNIDEHDGASQIVQIYDYRQPINVKPFIDFPEYMGVDVVGAVSLPGVISEVQTTIFPFNDRDFRSRIYLDGPDGAINGPNMVSAALALSGTFEVMLGEDQVSATAGFIYDNNPYGTDSLAFGGLKK